jgi:hypothetical protein
MNNVFNVKKKRNRAIFSCLLCCTVLLFSCSQDDPDIKLPEPDKSLYTSYFDGKLNGDAFYVENDYPTLPILSSREFSPVSDGKGGIADSVDILVSHISLNKTMELRIAILATMGERPLLSQTYPFNRLREDQIELIVYLWDVYGDRHPRRSYLSKEDRPFRANVLQMGRIMSEGPRPRPALTVELKGTLYNAENPADSIVIDATYASQPFVPYL